MTGRPLETGGPAPLGPRAGQLPHRDAFGKLPRTVRAPIPAMFQRGNGSGKRYVQAKSVVLGVPGQARPAALDGGR